MKEEHHHHHHHEVSTMTHLNRAFIIGITLNLLYVIIEFGAGFLYHSLSLISDAGHNLSDVAALALSLLAFRLAKVKANDKFTYGYRKSTILVSLVNSVVLFIVIGGIISESISRLSHPVVVQGVQVSVVAFCGILINAVSALLFFRDRNKDLNVKGAYLHLMSDAVVSLGVVVSGILMAVYHLYWLDMVMSLIIVIVIFYSTWNLFRDSLSLSLDGVPKGVHFNSVVEVMKSIDGVKDVHHVHIWAMSTTQNALTAHVVIYCNTTLDQQARIKHEMKEKLASEQVHHATLEFETQEELCTDMNKV
ncbi:MAG: cation diffusion facilitator family transporter [Microbacter sp.]